MAAARSFCVHGSPVSDAVQPTGNGSSVADRCSIGGENQKRDLKRIRSLMTVMQDSPAQIQHHSTVPPHQHLSSHLVPALDKSFEQLGIRQSACFPRQPNEVAQLPDNGDRRRALSIRAARSFLGSPNSGGLTCARLCAPIADGRRRVTPMRS